MEPARPRGVTGRRGMDEALATRIPINPPQQSCLGSCGHRRFVREQRCPVWPPQTSRHHHCWAWPHIGCPLFIPRPIACPRTANVVQSGSNVARLAAHRLSPPKALRPLRRGRAFQGGTDKLWSGPAPGGRGTTHPPSFPRTSAHERYRTISPTVTRFGQSSLGIWIIRSSSNAETISTASSPSAPRSSMNLVDSWLRSDLRSSGRDLVLGGFDVLAPVGVVGAVPLVHVSALRPGVPGRFQARGDLRDAPRSRRAARCDRRPCRRAATPACGALHEFPFAVAHGFVALVLPEDRLRAGQRLSFEGGPQADALHRLDRMAFELGADTWRPASPRRWP